MNKTKISLISGVIILIVGPFIGKESFVIKIGNQGISLSNIVVALGLIIIVYNTLLIIKNKNGNEMKDKL